MRLVINLYLTLKRFIIPLPTEVQTITKTTLEPICATIASATKFQFAPDYLIADAFLNFNTKE